MGFLRFLVLKIILTLRGIIMVLPITTTGIVLNWLK